MSHPNPELLELFCAEAEERLAVLAPLTSRVVQDPEAAHEVRRQLHALKGASRMLGLEELSATCHEAEEAAGRSGSEVDEDRLVHLVDRISARVREIRAGLAGGERPEETAPEQEEKPEGSPGVFVPPQVLDRLSEEATALRIAALGIGNVVQELGELVAVAARARSRDDVEQFSALLCAGVRRVATRADAASRRLERLARVHRDELLQLELQPLAPFLHELARHGRELAQRLGKRVHVVVEGGEVQLDRRIVRALESSLLHLVRNAVDHGIEPPAERARAGKPDTGRLELCAAAAGGRVRVRIADDGRGLQADAIAAAARERGLLAPGEPLPAPEELVLRPGFSTRDTATEVSGRGVGLDAVGTTVQRLGGELTLRSRPQRGLEVELVLPVVRRGLRIVVAAAGAAVLGVPAGAVAEIHGVTPKTLSRDENGSWRLVARGRVLEAVVLSPRAAQAGVGLELGAGGRRIALVVDTVLGREEVVVRPLPARAARGTPFEGMAVLSGGKPVPVLAPERLQVPRTGSAAVEDRSGTLTTPIRVLLADDSPVTRAMMQRLIEDAGFEVAGVGNGEEAWALLARESFHCLVTDIEMPHLDGLELTRRVRADRRFRDLPIVLVSTRDSRADRVAGLEAGADAYIAKQELRGDTLTETIRRLTGSTEPPL